MALGGGVQAVDRLGGDVHRGVEAERHVGRAEVVVDRLRDADHVQAVVVEALARRRACPRRRSRSARRAGGARASRGPARGPSSRSYDVGARAAEDRAAARQDPARGLDRQLHRRSPRARRASRRGSRSLGRRSASTRLAHDRADHRVQPRAVAASGEDSDPHLLECLSQAAASDRLRTCSLWRRMRERPNRWIWTGAGAAALAAAGVGGAAAATPPRAARSRATPRTMRFGTLRPAVRSRVRSADGTMLHAEVFGPEDGTTLVLAHGWTEMLDFWTYVIRDLTGQGIPRRRIRPARARRQRSGS